jgi:hypothetical protein
LRVSILIDEADGFSTDWIAAAAASCTVVLDADSPDELNRELWDAGVYVRLPGSDWDMSELSSEVPSMHQVLFTDRQMEANWSKALDI